MEDVFGWFEVVPRPIERLWTLVIRKADVHEQLFEVWMLKAILDSVALLRIEHKHLLK